MFALTAEFETQIAGYPANDATRTAIIATKHAGVTAMAETMTAVPSETPLPTILPDSPFCLPANLTSSSGSNVATQTLMLGAGLKNTGPQACFLQKWPDIRLIDRQGQPLDVDYGYFDIGFGSPEAAATHRALEYATAKVGLLPGWSAYLNLFWQNWCGGPIAGGVVIRMTFSNGTGVLDIPTDISGGTCSAPGARSYVGIASLVLGPPQ